MTAGEGPGGDGEGMGGGGWAADWLGESLLVGVWRYASLFDNGDNSEFIATSA